MWDEYLGNVRVIFVASAEEEIHVRALIDQALVSGECAGPDGKLSRWSVTSQGVGVLSSHEETLGVKIAGFRPAES